MKRRIRPSAVELEITLSPNKVTRLNHFPKCFQDATISALHPASVVVMEQSSLPLNGVSDMSDLTDSHPATPSEATALIAIPRWSLAYRTRQSN